MIKCVRQNYNPTPCHEILVKGETVKKNQQFTFFILYFDIIQTAKKKSCDISLIWKKKDWTNELNITSNNS